MSIPMLDLSREYQCCKNEIDAALSRCLALQRWILGPEVKEFEQVVSSYLGVKHCIGVSSGTDALVLALRALAIQRTGKEYFEKTDQIIVPTFTFTATGDAVLRAGATPVFVDIDSRTYNIDTKKTEEYLTTQHGNVIGIIPVHLYGQACDMDAIMELARRYNLFVVEDVAQAFGGKWKGKWLGSIGTAGAFSFFPSKNLGGYGDGGLVATDDEALAGLVRVLTKHGGKDKYNVEHIGYNARLDTIQAAILLAKIPHIDSFNEKRREVAERYNLALRQSEYIVVPRCLEGAYHVYHQYTIQVTHGKRDVARRTLEQAGISTMTYYPVLLSEMEVFKGNGGKAVGAVAHAKEVADQVLNLPIGPFQTK